MTSTGVYPNDLPNTINHTTSESSSSTRYDHRSSSTSSSSGRDSTTSSFIVMTTTRFKPQHVVSLRNIAAFTLVALASFAQIVVFSNSCLKETDNALLFFLLSETSSLDKTSLSLSTTTTTTIVAAVAEWNNNNNSNSSSNATATVLLSADDQDRDHLIAEQHHHHIDIEIDIHTNSRSGDDIIAQGKSRREKNETQVDFSSSSATRSNSKSAVVPVPLEQSPPQIPLPSIAYFFNNYCGLGSSLVNLFVNAAYFKDMQNRSLCVIESHYCYRFNASVGVLTGFFTPHFPVIDTPEQQSAWIKPHLQDLDDDDLKNMTDEWSRDDVTMNQIRQFNDQNPPVALVDTFLYHKDVVCWYQENITSVNLYGRLVQDMCPHLQFNDRIKNEIRKFRKRLRIPLAFGNNTNNQTESASTTIAFHIRRGDKLITKLKKYHTYQYLHTFERQVGVKVVRTLKHCFVATDDPAVIRKFRRAIQNHNHKWSCTVHFISPACKDIIFPDSTYQFLTEMSILLDAKYFVGTFNSNVGALVSILRSCPHRLDEDFSTWNYSHFGQSYGADRDDWFFW